MNVLDALLTMSKIKVKGTEVGRSNGKLCDVSSYVVVKHNKRGYYKITKNLFNNKSIEVEVGDYDKNNGEWSHRYPITNEKVIMCIINKYQKYMPNKIEL